MKVLLTLLILVSMTFPAYPRARVVTDDLAKEQRQVKIITCRPLPERVGFTTQDPAQLCTRPNVRFYAVTPDGETLKHILIPINVQ